MQKNERGTEEEKERGNCRNENRENIAFSSLFIAIYAALHSLTIY